MNKKNVSSAAAEHEPVVCAYVHGGGGGAASYRSHSVLLQDLQGPGAFSSGRQHHLRLQGERGRLSTGTCQMSSRTTSRPSLPLN